MRNKAITVNGLKLTIPSAKIKPGDVITVSEAAAKHFSIKGAAESAQQRGLVDWVDVNFDKLEGTYKNVPERSDLPSDINENLVVELYSK